MHFQVLQYRGCTIPKAVAIPTNRLLTFSTILQQYIPAKGCKVRLPIFSSQERLASQSCSAAATAEYGQLTDIGVPLNSYIALGLAHCFEKNSEGKLIDRMVIEPISANSLECMVLGAKTCFRAVTGVLVEEALAKDGHNLPEEFQLASFCSDYEYRLGASARTWLRPHAQDNLLDLVPLGQTRTKFNFNLDEKRVLNFENEVSDDDNIKQDMSIDVYGRKEKEDVQAAAKINSDKAEPPEARDDLEMDSLLST